MSKLQASRTGLERSAFNLEPEAGSPFSERVGEGKQSIQTKSWLCPWEEKRTAIAQATNSVRYRREPMSHACVFPTLPSPCCAGTEEHPSTSYGIELEPEITLWLRENSEHYNRVAQLDICALKLDREPCDPNRCEKRSAQEVWEALPQPQAGPAPSSTGGEQDPGQSAGLLPTGPSWAFSSGRPLPALGQWSPSSPEPAGTREAHGGACRCPACHRARHGHTRACRRGKPGPVRSGL